MWALLAWCGWLDRRGSGEDAPWIDDGWRWLDLRAIPTSLTHLLPSCCWQGMEVGLDVANGVLNPGTCTYLGIRGALGEEIPAHLHSLWTPTAIHIQISGRQDSRTKASQASRAGIQEPYERGLAVVCVPLIMPFARSGCGELPWAAVSALQEEEGHHLQVRERRERRAIEGLSRLVRQKGGVQILDDAKSS